jgi:hypothetical protein
VSKDPRMLSTDQFAEHLVKDRGWETASPRLVRHLCRMKRIPRAQFVAGVWVIPRGAMVIGRPRGKKRPDTEPPDPRTHPEDAVEYVMALARAAGIR